MRFSASAAALLAGVVVAEPLTTITPCPGATSSTVKPITVTEQYQEVSTCATTSACFRGSCVTKYPLETYKYVSTVIPAAWDGTKAETTTVTSTTQSVTVSRFQSTITKWVTPTGVVTKNGTTSVPSPTPIHLTIAKDFAAPYNKMGPLAIPGWEGSGLCEECETQADGSRSQVVDVVECRAGPGGSKCMGYEETWISKPAPSTSAKTECPVATHFVAPSAGTYTFTFPFMAPAKTMTADTTTITVDPQPYYVHVTRACHRPNEVIDFTTTITKTIYWTAPCSRHPPRTSSAVPLPTGKHAFPGWPRPSKGGNGEHGVDESKGDPFGWADWGSDDATDPNKEIPHEWADWVVTATVTNTETQTNTVTISPSLATTTSATSVLGPIDYTTSSTTGAASTTTSSTSSFGAGPIGQTTSTSSTSSFGAGPIGQTTSTSSTSSFGAGPVDQTTSTSSTSSFGAGPVDQTTSTSSTSSFGAGPVDQTTSTSSLSTTTSTFTTTSSSSSFGAGPVDQTTSTSSLSTTTSTLTTTSVDSTTASADSTTTSADSTTTSADSTTTSADSTTTSSTSSSLLGPIENTSSTSSSSTSVATTTSTLTTTSVDTTTTSLSTTSTFSTTSVDTTTSTITSFTSTTSATSTSASSTTTSLVVIPVDANNFVIGVNSAAKYRKRALNYIRFDGEDGVLTPNKEDAALFSLENGYLKSGGLFVDADTTQPYIAFSLVASVNVNISKWTLGADGTISLVSFSIGVCVAADSSIFIEFTQNTPFACVEVQLVAEVPNPTTSSTTSFAASTTIAVPTSTTTSFDPSGDLDADIPAPTNVRRGVQYGGRRYGHRRH